MEQSLVDAIEEYDIIIDEKEGLTEIAPSVIMFYGVSRNCHLRRGKGRQMRYIALYDEGSFSIDCFQDYTCEWATSQHWWIENYK